MTQQGMSTKSRHLTIPDLITIGVFTALYFVLVAVATLFSSVALMGFGMILLPAVAALICGCVYMLLVAKVGKFGAISVMGIVVGLFLFVSGHFILSLAASIVFPVIADAIARAGDYRSKTGILASYVVFCYGLTGPILPLWFMKDAYVASLQARGKDSSYIDGVFAHVNTGTFFIAMIVVLVCALLGGWFGQEQIEEAIARIQEGIDRFNKEGQLPLQLSLSIGYAFWHEAGRRGENLIQQADERMYEEKQKKKRMRA